MLYRTTWSIESSFHENAHKTMQDEESRNRTLDFTAYSTHIRQTVEYIPPTWLTNLILKTDEADGFQKRKNSYTFE